jgi:D-alanine-D-alanine ligase
MSERVVLVADTMDDVPTIGAERFAEVLEPEYLDGVTAGLSEAGFDLIHYHGPRDFIKNIAEHQSDVVLPLWSGAFSRNRKCLVQAICEANDICYIGADPYTQLVCADKVIAKQFAVDHGLSVAPGVTITDQFDFPAIRQLRPPLIIKPRFEGGSIGVSDFGVCNDFESAEAVGRSLLVSVNQPLLAEEFVSGREVCVCLLGAGAQVQHSSTVVLNVPSMREEDLKCLVFGTETKKNDRLRTEWLPLNSSAIEAIAEPAKRLFQSLDKVEIIRLDGRIKDDVFVLLELSPDIHLGPKASFAKAMAIKGMSYPTLLSTLVTNARDAHRLGNANGTGCQDQSQS